MLWSMMARKESDTVDGDVWVSGCVCAWWCGAYCVRASVPRKPERCRANENCACCTRTTMCAWCHTCGVARSCSLCNLWAGKDSKRKGQGRTLGFPTSPGSWGPNHRAHALARAPHGGAALLPAGPTGTAGGPLSFRAKGEPKTAELRPRHAAPKGSLRVCLDLRPPPTHSPQKG